MMMRWCNAHESCYIAVGEMHWRGDKRWWTRSKSQSPFIRHSSLGNAHWRLALNFDFELLLLSAALSRTFANKLIVSFDFNLIQTFINCSNLIFNQSTCKGTFNLVIWFPNLAALTATLSSSWRHPVDWRNIAILSIRSSTLVLSRVTLRHQHLKPPLSCIHSYADLLFAKLLSPRRMIVLSIRSKFIGDLALSVRNATSWCQIKSVTTLILKNMTAMTTASVSTVGWQALREIETWNDTLNTFINNAVEADLDDHRESISHLLKRHHLIAQERRSCRKARK